MGKRCGEDRTYHGQMKQRLQKPRRHVVSLERKEGVYKPEAYQTFEIIMRAKQGHVKAHRLRVVSRY